MARLGCGECGRENPATGRTCYWCAAPVCAMCAVGSDSDLHVGHFCSACGRRKSSCLFGEGMRFCRQCGIRRPDDEGASAPLPLTKTGGHDNGCASDWALALTPDVLSKIFLSFGGIRDIVTCALVNRQWYAVARSKVVWRSLFVSRWGWASSRWWRDVKEATGWFRIYARRHQLLFENSRQESVGATTQMPAPIEDCHRSSCPGLWENLPPDTRRGQIVKTRRCFDCRATVVRCETADEAQLCVDDGCLDAEIASWFPGDSGYPAAFLLARDPVKTTDWMFSPWYGRRLTMTSCVPALVSPIRRGVPNHILDIQVLWPNNTECGNRITAALSGSKSLSCYRLLSDARSCCFPLPL